MAEPQRSRRQATRAAFADWLTDAVTDARIAARSYRRQPSFTLVVLLTLGVGIGATTAMFSIVNGVLLRPPPYPRPDQLVLMRETHRTDAGARPEASYLEYLDWRARRDLFTAVEGYDETNVTVSGPIEAEMVRGARVTAGFLAMLGASPVRGTTFVPEDDTPDARVVVLGYELWSRRFAADSGIVGRTVTIDGLRCVVRGVLAPRFRFAPAGDAELWLPVGRDANARAERFNRWLNVVARLRDGITAPVAEGRIAGLMREMALRYPQSNAGRGVSLIPLGDAIAGDSARPLGALFGAVAMVLLIACANVASLTVTRSLERSREIAVRSAIGASRARLVRQLVIEHVMLGLAGGALGSLLAAALVRVAIAAAPLSLVDRMPMLRDASVDVTALGFTAIVAAVTALGFGSGAALLALRRSAADALRSGNRVGSTRAHRKLRDGIVTIEMAMTFVLLVAAALMLRSVTTVLRVDPGFSAESVGTVRIALTGPRYEAGRSRQRFFEEVVSRLRGLPGVVAVGAISNPPLQGGGSNAFRVDGEPEPDPSARPEATLRAVAGDYFRALGITMTEGRALGAGDDTLASYAMVINASLARRLFGRASAVGRRLRIYNWQDSAWTIVGVARDVKTGQLDEAAPPTIYYSHLQGPSNRMTVVVRGASAAPALPTLRRVVDRIDPNVAIYSSGTMAELVARSPAVSNRRSLLAVFGCFAVAALGLSLVGLYGVLAHAVAQRAREMSIRSALGASAAHVVALVMRDGIRVAAVGVAVGGISSLALTRALSSLLFGVRPTDAWTYVMVAALLFAMAVLASWVPARRAGRVDPAVALRND